MSRENSPDRDVAARAGSFKEGTSKEGSATLTGNQFTLLMEEVRRLREGQEDAALKCHIKRDCPKKALGTSSQYPSHESYKGSMGSKGVDFVT